MAKEVSDALRGATESAAKPAFTPGPWEADIEGVGWKPGNSFEDHNEVCHLAHSTWGISVYAIGNYPPSAPQAEHEANSRLISAAPRMYAVLKAIMSDTCVSVESGNEIRDIFKGVEGR